MIRRVLKDERSNGATRRQIWVGLACLLLVDAARCTVYVHVYLRTGADNIIHPFSITRDF